MKQPDLYYFETMQMTSQATSLVIVHREYSPVARISIQNLTGLVMSFLWFQNSVDQAIS